MVNAQIITDPATVSATLIEALWHFGLEWSLEVSTFSFHKQKNVG